VKVTVVVPGFPPKKDGAQSMWRKRGEQPRIIALRRALHTKLGPTVFAGHVALDLELRISDDRILTAGDLDNFVTGICDSLMAANGLPRTHGEYSDSEWEGIEPDRVIALPNDATVVAISARKIPTLHETSY